MQTIPVVLNANAGANAAESGVPERVREAFAARGMRADIALARPGELQQALRAQVEKADDLLVVGGGDGTVNAAASLLADADLTLGILPLGTLNYFARTVGLPLDLRDAAATIATGTTGRVDLGQLGERVFLNNSSLGVYPRVLRVREQHRRRNTLRDRVSALTAMFGAFWRYAWLDVELEDVAPRGRVRTPVLVVGNNVYRPTSPGLPERERLDEGCLWVCTAPRTRRATLLRLGVQMALGHEGAMRELEEDRCSSFTVSWRGGPRLVSLDGETLSLRSPLTYRIRPGALRVVMPAKGDDER